MIIKAESETIKEKTDILFKTCFMLFVLFSFMGLVLKVIFNVDWYFAILPKKLDIPLIVEHLINSCLLVVNTFFIILIINKFSIKKSLLLSIIFFIPFYLVNHMNIFVQELQFIFPIILCFIPFKKYNIKLRVINSSFLIIYFIIMSFIFIQLKLNLFKVEYINSLIILICSIDLFISLYFLNKITTREGNYYVEFIFLFSRCRYLFRGISQDKKKQKVKRPIGFYFYLIKTQMLQMLLVLISSCVIISGVKSLTYNTYFLTELRNSLLSFLFLYLSFVVARIFYKTSFHSKSLWGCSALSCLIFGVLNSANIPLGISIYFGIILGASTALILNIIGENFNKANSFDNLYIEYEQIQLEKRELQLEKRILELEIKQEEDKSQNQEKEIIANLYALSEEDLRIFLHKKTLTVSQIEALCLHICKDMKWSEVKKALSYSRSGMDCIVSNIKSKLSLGSKTRL